MKFLLPPKIIKWDYNLSQTHSCNQKKLVTSGCSFTASTLQLDSAASWPGFLRDRCRFVEAVDMSYPGMGNDYIYESILDQADSDCIVVVMWSGIDRKYARLNPPEPLSTRSISDQEKCDRAQMSFEAIKKLKSNLTQKNIPHAFTQYINLLYPPYLPFNDTTRRWTDYFKTPEIDQIRSLISVPKNPKDFLFDFCFYNDFVGGDNYHPPVECNLAWTDKVLLPNLVELGLVQTVDQ